LTRRKRITNWKEVAMARRDSNPDPLGAPNSSSRTTTLDTTENTGASGVSGTAGSGTLGSSGLSGASSGAGVSGTSGAYGTTGTLGTTGTSGAYGSGATNPNNWQRAGQENLGGSQGAATQVKNQAKGLASEAKQEALGMAGQARDHVQNLVGERKDRAAEQLGSFAGSLRDAALKLEDGDGGATALGRYAQTAADQVERVSQYLRDRDLNTFVRDAETFARRHPDVFLGGTFIAGLILARFFKASERRHQDELVQDWQTASYGETPYGYAGGSAYGTGTSYGNTYNTTAPTRPGSTYEEESSENAWSPGGPVPPVGG
jgi:hypothetical protein